MNPLSLSPLQIITERFSDKEASFDIDEVESWPEETREILLQQSLIKPTSTLKKVITCYECESLCLKSVQMRMDNNGQITPFIHCSEREDIGRVAVAPDSLKQWISTAEDFAAVLPPLLKTKAISANQQNQNNSWYLGVSNGKNGLIPVLLHIKPEIGLVLVIEDHHIPLAEILSIKRKKLHIDYDMVQCLLDEAKNMETAEQRRERLQKRVNELKVKGRRDFLAQTAREEGISTARLKTKLKSSEKQDEIQNHSPLTALFSHKINKL